MKYFYTFFKGIFATKDEVIFVLAKDSNNQHSLFCSSVEGILKFENASQYAEEWLYGLVLYYELGEDPAGYTYQKLRPEPFLTNENPLIREIARISIKNETITN